MLLSLPRDEGHLGSWRSRFVGVCTLSIGTVTVTAPRPLFSVVLRDGDEWLIEAEWPDGSIEHVCTFKAHSDAAKWLKTQSQTWLQERT
jgi:hypothetical protein